MSALSIPFRRSLPVWAVRTRTIVIAFAAAGLALRLGIAFRNLDVVDRLFVPDDTYYTLSIARSLAAGTGPAADAIHVTNGFQPLIAFLLTPVFAITHDHDVGLRAAILLGVVFDLGNSLLLGRLAFRLGGKLPAVVAVAVWSLSPLAIGNALNGLETSLAIFFQLLLAELWWRAEERDGTWPWVAVGAVAGLALLARIDAVFLIAALGLVALLRGGRWRIAIAAAVAGLVVAPWWIYSVVHFGSPIPESGSAVQEIVAVQHRAYGLDAAGQMGWAAGTVLGAPLETSSALRAFLYHYPALGVMAWLGTIGGVVAVLWRTRRRLPPVALALAINGLALLVFYTLIVPAPWFFQRYLGPCQALLTLLLAVGVGSAWRARHARPIDSAALFGAVGLIAVFGLAASVTHLWRNPAVTPTAGYNGAKGYREESRDVLSHVQPGNTIGSLQSGALGYYAPAGVRVVNLDGVVDHEAAKAFRDKRIAAFARERGVTAFADWGLNTSVFIARAGIPGFSMDNLQPLATARDQGANEAFTLYAVRWPPG